FVKSRWGFDVVVWKGDGEKSFGSKWIVWINSHGYDVETSSPHIQEQNGDAERAGGILQILDKILPRAEIGYLVSYDSKNIFRIWIPSRNIVISTRDVTFDPTEGYSPNSPSPIIANEFLEVLQVPQLEIDSSDNNIEIYEKKDDLEVHSVESPKTRAAEKVDQNDSVTLPIQKFSELKEAEHKIKKIPKGYVEVMEDNDKRPK
ncbi:hypothetical protein GcM3_184041, partial [Golovinomyces cichoracearum]